jgi:hypothetical protein
VSFQYSIRERHVCASLSESMHYRRSTADGPASPD